MNLSLRIGRLVILGIATFTTAISVNAQRVWVVDDDGGVGVDETVIQTAVNLAADGDLVLVKDGSYGEVNIVAKSISLVAEEGASVVLFGNSEALTISNLSTTQGVTVRGLTLQGGDTIATTVEDCEGLVQMEDCTFVRGLTGIFSGRAVLNLDFNEHVVLVDCDAVGDVTKFTVWMSPSFGFGTVDMFGCNFAGGASFDSTNPGGTAMAVLEGLELYLYDSVIVGGAGNMPASCTGFSVPTNGGHAIDFFGNAVATVRMLLTTVVQGGAAGDPAGCGSIPPIPGEAFFDSDAGSVQRLPHFARGLEIPSPVRAGDVVDFAYRGLPGDLVFRGATYGPLSDGMFFAVLAGPTYLFSNGSFEAEFVGVLDANGTLTHSVDTSGFLPPGMQHVPIIVQPIHFLAGNGFVVSYPRSFEVLDAGL